MGLVERLGQQEEGEQEGDGADPGRRIEGHARAELAEHAADQRAGDETDAEGGADQPEIRRPLLRRRDVGDIGGGGRHRRAHDAADDARQRDDPQIGRHRQQDVVDAEAGERDQHDRPAAEAVRQRAEGGAEEELHQRVERQQQAVEGSRLADRVAAELLHQERDDRQHDADAEDVDDHGPEQDHELGALLHRDDAASLPERASCRKSAGPPRPPPPDRPDFPALSRIIDSSPASRRAFQTRSRPIRQAARLPHPGIGPFPGKRRQRHVPRQRRRRPSKDAALMVRSALHAHLTMRDFVPGVTPRRGSGGRRPPAPLR